MRFGGKAATDAKGKAVLDIATANAPCSGKGNVIDFRVAAPGAAAGDGHLEFARQIVKLAIAAEGAIHGQGKGRCIEIFVARKASDGAPGHIANNVAASASGSQASLLQLLDDVGNGFDGDPVELKILADGNVGDTAGVVFGKFGEDADLIAVQDTVGDTDADHKEFGGFAFAIGAADDSHAVALGVNAPGTEVGAEPFGWDGGAAIAGECADFIEVIPGELFAF